MALKIKNLTRRFFVLFSQQTVKRSDETHEFCKFSRLLLLTDEVLTAPCLQIGSPCCCPGTSSSTSSCDPGSDLVLAPAVLSDSVSPTSCNLLFIVNHLCPSVSRTFFTPSHALITLPPFLDLHDGLAAIQGSKINAGFCPSRPFAFSSPHLCSSQRGAPGRCVGGSERGFMV